MESSTPTSDDDYILPPRAASEMLGVTPQTLAQWSRMGKLPFKRTLGGHRRYSFSAVQQAREANTARKGQNETEREAARLYAQGWSIRQVAVKFDWSYETTRRVLQQQIDLRMRNHQRNHQS